MRSAVLGLCLAALLSGCLGSGEPLVQSSLAPAAPALPAFAPVTQLRADLADALASGEPIVLPAARVDGTATLGARLSVPFEVPLLLKPSSLLAEDLWVEVADAPAALPRLEVYEGTVEGAENSLVRLVVTDAWARGAVRVGDQWSVIRIGLNGNLPFVPDPAGEGSSAPGPAWAMTQDRQAPPALFEPPNWQEDELDCLRAAPPYATPMADLAQAAASPITARILLDGDALFARALGPHALPMMVAMLAEVDLIYEYEVGIRFQAVGLHLHDDPAQFLDPGEETPLVNLSAYWNDREGPERDITHLFTGYESSYAMANCIGGAGDPELAYTFTPLNWERNMTVFHTNAFAHELGHIFSAHHHYGNHVESGGQGATIMIQGYTPGFRPVFGSLEKAVIRGWAEAEVAGSAGDAGLAGLGRALPDLGGLS